MLNRSVLLLAAAVLFCAVDFVAAAETALVAGGKALATIVVDESVEAEKTAAAELKEHIELMSGVALPIASEAGKTAVNIYIGSKSNADLAPIRKVKDDPASLRVVVSGDAIHLVGLSPQGSLFAAYELLEQLGVRWYMPGEIGRVVPKRATVAVTQQDTVQVPGFTGRHLQAVQSPVWRGRMRLGGLDTGSHGMGPKFSNKTEPHLFMSENEKVTHQVDVANEEVFNRVVAYWLKRLETKPTDYMRIGPEDGSGYGEHEWDAGDVDPLSGEVAVTDRYIKFFNRVLDAIQEKHPEVGLGFYAYGQHMRPPVREKPNAKILPMLAPIDLCRIHSINSPHCWERHYIRDLIDAWQASGLNMMYRGYFFNLCNPGIPYSMTRQIADELPYFHKQGIVGCRVETMAAWSFHGPSLYLAARMYWNPYLDSEALLDEYFALFYGPAGDSVQRYFDIIEDAYMNADYHTGNVFDVPHILGDEVMAKMNAALTEAESAVEADSAYGQRVAMIRTGYRSGELILGVIDAWKHCDFGTAKRLADEVRPILIDGMEHDPPLFHKSIGIGYFNRFWGGTADHGYSVTHDGNEKVVQLPDEWLFMFDPYMAGDKLGLYKDTLGDQSWTKMRTYSDSWSNQGMRYAKGDGWYRTRVDLPADVAGRELVLWLGGADNDPAAWLNGQPLEMTKKGASPIGRPWEFEIADHAKPGETNVLVIRVRNNILRELGTGGLTGPVMIYKRKQ